MLAEARGGLSPYTADRKIDGVGPVHVTSLGAGAGCVVSSTMPSGRFVTVRVSTARLDAFEFVPDLHALTSASL